MTSHQLKNPYGFFAPYIPMPKGRGFTARLVKGWYTPSLKAPNRIELLHNGFADRSLTAWVRRHDIKYSKLLRL